MAHTPGPWVVKNLEPSTIGHDWVDGPDRRGIAVCGDVVGNGPHGYCQSVDTDEIAANALLIAAAPDLLDALEDMAAGWRYIRKHYGDLPGVGWDRAQFAAEAAIAKATEVA